jgi:hypothetical protein
MTRHDRMMKEIKKHGENLKVVFNLEAGIDPVKLCKSLRRIEIKAQRLALALCNGDIDEITDDQKTAIFSAVDKLLHYKAAGIPVFFNKDPRGYALKIDDAYVRDHNVTISRDWGGYGIIAPEFDGKR